MTPEAALREMERQRDKYKEQYHLEREAANAATRLADIRGEQLKQLDERVQKLEQQLLQARQLADEWRNATSDSQEIVARYEKELRNVHTNPNG